MSIYDALLTEETVTLESLTKQHRTIGLEAANLSQVFSAATDRLPALVEDARTFIATTLNPFAPKPALVDSQRLEKELQGVDYLSLADVALFVPAGFKGRWLDYVALLSDSQAVLDQLVNGLLIPYERYLGQLLNHPAQLKALNCLLYTSPSPRDTR